VAQARFSGFEVEVMTGTECKAELSSQWPVQPWWDDDRAVSDSSETGHVLLGEHTAAAAGFVFGGCMAIVAVAACAYLRRKKPAAEEGDGTGSREVGVGFILRTGRDSATAAPCGDDSTGIHSVAGAARVQLSDVTGAIGRAWASMRSFSAAAVAHGAEAMGRASTAMQSFTASVMARGMQAIGHALASLQEFINVMQSRISSAQRRTAADLGQL